MLIDVLKSSVFESHEIVYLLALDVFPSLYPTPWFCSFPFTRVTGPVRSPQSFRVNIETYNLRGAIHRNPSCDFHPIAWESSNTDHHSLVECVIELECVINIGINSSTRHYPCYSPSTSVHIVICKKWQKKIAPPLKPWTRPRN